MSIVKSEDLLVAYMVRVRHVRSRDKEEEERHSWQDDARKGSGRLVPESLRSHAEGLGLNPESKRNPEGETCPDVHFTKTTWDVCRVGDVGCLQPVLEAFKDLGSW